MAPATRVFFYVNVLVFLVMYLFGLEALIAAFFALAPTDLFPVPMVWKLATYGFLHANFAHLLSNMIALFFFGSAVEMALGRTRYVQLILLAILAGGLAHSVFHWGQPVLLVGFSGAVFAILAGCLVFIPNQRVYFNLLIPIKMKWLVIAYLAFETISIFSGGRSNISHEGHIAGALTGFAFILLPAWWKRRGGGRPRGGGGRRGGKRVKSRVISMGHPGRSAKASDLYDDPHWRLDQ